MKTQEGTNTALDVDIMDYEELMKKPSYTKTVSREWTQQGDFFKRFSMYEEYTPVKTSSNTTLTKNI